MKLRKLFPLVILVSTALLSACNNDSSDTKTAGSETDVPKGPQVKQETVTYQGDGISMKGFVAYDQNKEGKRPIVMLIPEWWGLTDYARSRATQLAELGYVAFAVDLYGDGKTADNPDAAMKLSGPFYNNAAMMQARFDAALATAKGYAQSDSSKVATIGYCFGGAQALNLARLGEDFKGVVSFHGNLIGVPADKSKLKAEILVCHGDADPYVKPGEVAAFRKQMDSIGAHYTFRAYPGAVHAFTNPAATALGEKFKMSIRYDAAADTASWNEMKQFFGRIF